MTDKTLLSGLETIDDARSVQTRPLTVLERLLDIGDKIVDKHSKEMPNNYDASEIKLMDSFYTRLYLDVLQRTRDINFDEQDIASFVRAKASHDLVGKQAQVLGIYSGCLAQLLTERNALQGKRTIIHLDGHIGDNLNDRFRFDYLFYFARVLDTVILENFNGEEILAYAGSFGGRADTLVCSGINGNYLLNFCGNYHGRLNKVIAINVAECEQTLSGCGAHSGQVLQIIEINIKGHSTLSSCATGNGYIDQIIGVGVDGIGTFLGILGVGKIHQIIAVDINGNDTLKSMNFYDELDQIIYDNISDSVITSCKEHIDGKKVRETYKEDEAERIEMVIGLVRSLKGKPYHEVLAIADELYALRYTCGRCFTEGVVK